MNVVALYSPEEGYVVYVIPRSNHRPACYGNGEGERLVSPGTLDMCGLVITPRECDFNDISADEALSLLSEVALSDEAFDAACEKIIGGL